MSNKKCIVIPVHIGKANWLIAFLSSIEAVTDQIDFDLILGASNDSEYRLFAALLPNILKKTHVNVVNVEDCIRYSLKSEELLARYNENKDRCIINVKKILLMYWALTRDYEQIVSIDSDTISISSFDKLFDNLKFNYEKNIYIGTSHERGDLLGIMHDCSRHFGLSGKDIFRSSNSKPIYTWFFDAPYYELNDLRSFFDYMSRAHGSFVGWLLTIRYEDFEHLIFQYWRALERGTQFFDTASFTDNFLPECYLYRHLSIIYETTGYCPSWVYMWNYLHQPDMVLGLPKVHMLSHFDRMGLAL